MAVNKLTEKPPSELGLASDVILSVTEIDEGSEPKEFFTGELHILFHENPFTLKI